MKITRTSESSNTREKVRNSQGGVRLQQEAITEVSPTPGKKSEEWLGRAFVCALTCLIGIAASSTLNAAQERYDYDARGRLVRVIDEQGRITEYVYDAAGNIVQVIRSDVSQAPPTVSAVTPNTIYADQTTQVQLTGSNLLGATVSSADASLRVSVESATQTDLVLLVAAQADALAGPKQLTVTNAAGSASATLDVRPALALSTVPSLIAVPPDSLAHGLVVQLSDSTAAATTFSVSAGDATIASVSPSLITVPAGQTEFNLTIAGIRVGRTALNIASSALSFPQAFPVYVTPNSSPRSALLGVFLPSTTAAPPVLMPAPLLGVSLASTAGGQGNALLADGPLVGVAYGATLRSIDPAVIMAGSTATLTVTGNSLGTVTSLSLDPPDGITVGSPLQISPDSTQVSASISVAADASSTGRTVVVSDATGQIQFPDVRASILNVVSGPPQLGSLTPSAASAGAALTLSIQGANLYGAGAVTAEPQDGITFTTAPIVTADGARLTVNFKVDPDAQSGARVIRVVTPVGTSSSLPGPGNTFTINVP